MNNKNRIPWLVAAAAMLFAMIVLVRNEISPDRPLQYSQPEQPVIRAIDDGSSWRPTRGAIPTPVPGDFSPWVATPTPPPTPVPTVSPTKTPDPTPSPTPKPLLAFRGIVQDDYGKGVARALVRVISGEPDRAAERSAVTGSDGRFLIEDIPDELLDKVIVELQGYATTMLENIPLTFTDELQIGMSALAGIDVNILDFSTTGAEPIMYSGKMQASLLRLSRGDEISTNVFGIPEPVLPVDTYLPVRDQNVIVADGLLQFDNVEPGSYRVAVKTGVKVAESEVLLIRDNARTSTTLTLGMKHTVKGNVLAGDTGKMLPQASVGLSPAIHASAAPDFPDYLSFTDGAGEFVIPEVQPGRYWMIIGASGYTTKTLENYEVLPGAPPEATSITLTKQNPLITVSLVNGEGRPIAEAPLVLMPVTGPTPKMYFGKTDEAGLYRFENLVPGKMNLSVTAPGDKARQKTLTFELGDGEVKEVPIQFGAVVNVKGKANRDGKAYNGVLTFVQKGIAIADNLVTTDATGAFTISLEPGDYVVGTPDKPPAVLIKIDSQESQNINVDLK